MPEYTKAGDGAQVAMPVPHEDAERESAHGPGQGLPDTKASSLTQALCDEAKREESEK